MKLDLPDIRIFSPEIATYIRPLQAHGAPSMQGARKKMAFRKKMGKQPISDISNVLQVKPIPMKPKDDGPMARNMA